MKYIHILLISLCVISCGGENESYDDSGSIETYKFEFGEIPTPDIKKIHAKQLIIADACRAWLKFEAGASLSEELKRKGFHVISKQEFDQNSGGANIPSWWEIKSGDDAVFYGFNHWKNNFTNSMAVFWYDKDSKLMYFCHDADSPK